MVPEAWAHFGLGPIPILHGLSMNLNKSSVVVREWLLNHREFHPEPLPSKSEDLNPFNTIWSEFEAYFRLQRTQPLSAEEIWDGLEKLWGYRSEKKGYWEGLILAFKANLENAIL